MSKDALIVLVIGAVIVIAIILIAFHSVNKDMNNSEDPLGDQYD